MTVTHHDAVLLAAYALAAAGTLASGCALRPRFGRDQYVQALESARSTPPPDWPEPELEPDPSPPARSGQGRRPRPGRVRRRLADPATWEAVAAAVGRAADEAAPAWPYAVVLGRDAITVRLAGAPGREPGEPWRDVPGGWSAGLDRITALRPPGRAEVAGISDTYIAIGAYGRDLVLLDLGCVPGVMTVTGDKRAARELVSALLAQIESVAGHRVLVARDALPDAPERGLSELLDGLDRLDGIARPSPNAPGPARGGGRQPVFLVCADPTGEEALRLRRAVARHPWLRVLVLGDLDGSQWSLTVEHGGWVTAPGLGLAAASAVLPDSVPERSAPGRVPPDRDAPAKAGRSAGSVPPAGAPSGQPARSVPAGSAPARAVPSPGAPAFDSTITLPVRRNSPAPTPAPAPAPTPIRPEAEPARNAVADSPEVRHTGPGSNLERTLEIHRALAPLPERDPGPPTRPFPAPREHVNGAF